MKMSELLAPTLREVPAEAEIPSHQLLVRAGYMRKVAGGLYTYLPLGLRVLQKIEAIIRQEMDSSAGQELLMPIMQPKEIWEQTGRWDVYGEEMFRLSDRHSRDFCLGPTHEELITYTVSQEVRSHRQLPLLLYQIQNKYRDEIRPRFGLMRAREFIMKDAYSFDRTDEGLDEVYWRMYKAYARIFARCGLSTRPVEADSGAIGGNASHEFMALAQTGEASIAFCKHCDYAANVERAECGAEAVKNSKETLPLKTVATPGLHTVEEVASFLGAEPQQLIKTMIYLADGKPIAVLVRGDHEVNEVKVANHTGAMELALADPATISKVTGAPVGFAGPVGLVEKIPLYADHSVMAVARGVVGANRKDAHTINLDPSRDLEPLGVKVADLRLVQDGDQCPRCKEGKLELARGIEVGQVFKLGTKYSEALGATYLDEEGKSQPMIMGCYGIGVSRTMAAVIEQNFDEHGIIWPVAIAPYHVIIVPVNWRDEKSRTASQELYSQLQKQGVEVILDDRDERPGVKFKDADLLGIPLRVTIGPKTLAQGAVEIKTRKGKQMELVAKDEAGEWIAGWLRDGGV
jgi:prolyl-tRNA synthetase